MSYDKNNHLLSQVLSGKDVKVRYIHDKGNLISDNNRRYTWDAFNRLIKVTNKSNGSVVAKYDYDEKGRRVRSTVGAQVINYVYDGDSIRVLYETNAVNQVMVIRYYTYNRAGSLLSMTNKGVSYYYHTNARGDIVAITNGKNQILARYVR